ncbi:hypothetical protein M0805_000943 [Coniferiporia weirii]|nr:hypothetical protein M0805_000943 [Coniferiporia weirii]
MPPKSIFRQPGARHFQLVHRSQRDPLIHDPDASQHVLKPIVKGQSRTDLELSLAPADLAHDLERANIGEASLFGVYYDDTEYDYMQHLRQVGLREDGVEGVLIEAPAASSSKKRMGRAKGDGKDRARLEDDLLRDLPREALPSVVERSREEVYGSQAAVPPELVGLQPDMDPHLRQTLEALDDDAFVDDALEDDFFSALVNGGERDGSDDEECVFEFAEEGMETGDEDGHATELKREKAPSEDEDEEDGNWQTRFAKFKKEHEARTIEGSEEPDTASDIRSEGGDTVGKLPTLSVIGGKKRRKGASDASGYSMSSSSMFRNDNLTLLDERFNQIEKEYASDEEDELSDDSDEAPELITSREDFNAIMDDFLDNYEILGGKMRHVLPGGTTAGKLGTIRQSLKEIGYDAHEQLVEDEEDNDGAFEDYTEEKGERWDCETILSTYSNLENHPRLIRARETRSVPKIHLDPKTGLPFVKPAKDEGHLATELKFVDSETIRPTVHISVARPRNESKEEKRVRKQVVKEERQARRLEKKATKDQFSNEKKHQLQVLANLPKKGVRKL